MARNKKIAISAALVIVLVAVVILTRGRGDKTEYETETAQIRNLQQTVSTTGELVSEDEIGLNFETAGRIDSIKAWVGKEVAQGEVIATIDAAEFGQQLQQAEAALDQALASAGASDDAIREAQQSYDDTKDYLDAVEELEDQKVDAADQAYDDAVEYYETVEAYYDNEASDHGQDSAEAKYARISLKSALTSKNAAEEAKSTARKSRDLSIRSAKNSRNMAEEKLVSAKSDYVERSNNSAVKNARAAYNIALLNLDKTSLRAPANGVITQLTYRSGEVLGSASFDLASSATTAFARMISSDFIIESQVPESDIVKIKKGQKATVTFDSFDEAEVSSAEVVEIDPASTIIQDVVYYEVKLRLSDLDARLKAGMSADIDIRTAEKNNVIAVPQRAVKQQNGKTVVELLDDRNQPKPVDVKTGLRGDDGLIEITSGLKGGENVVTFIKEEK